MGKIGDKKFVVGSFGRNHQIKKKMENKHDRFQEEELSDILPFIKRSFRAWNDPKNYRYDNTVWIAELADGEKKAIYTRLNRFGDEEIINWHNVPKTKYPNFIQKLEDFGTPNRT